MEEQKLSSDDSADEEKVSLRFEITSLDVTSTQGAEPAFDESILGPLVS